MARTERTPLLEQDRTTRGVTFLIVACILGGVVCARLANLQLAQGDKFLKQAEGNRLRIIPHLAPRGVIRDRHGRVLASNRLSYSLALYPIKMPKKKIEEVIDKLHALLPLDVADVHMKIEKAGYNSTRPIKLVSDIDQKVIAVVAEHQADLPGVSIEPDTIRFYPRGHTAVHVIGYTGEVTDSELAADKDEEYHQGDIIGKGGLERLHDKELRGEMGSQQVEVDSRGRPVQVIRNVAAKPGKDLKLFLDLDMQAVAEKALDDDKLTGAVVAMNPQTGEVYAMASRPYFDPNIFSRKVKPDEWKTLQTSNFPFVNRATSAYPPGSIFKIPMTLAALESGRTTENRYFNSTGSLQVGNRIFHDWSARGFGRVNIVSALQWSIDTVYYQLGVEMGGAIMSRYAHETGLGEHSGIELGDAAGLVPDPVWKRRVWKDKWWPGDSANMSIGQGAVIVTPLQAAVMVSAIANGGKVLVPRLVDDGKPLPPRKVSTWNPKNLALVHKGMRAVISSGTGTVADIPGKDLAGKTGSAESGKPKTHSWFVCYGPQKNPTIAVVVFAEAAGHGGTIAGPVARKVLDQFFGLKEGKIQRVQTID
ncbi:MAG: penicillin-binding protein [Cyanobacteria bacterium RYN_339]|nr:penicillin-binding protein [Cyanobacteria bacterium RYN_339]